MFRGFFWNSFISKERQREIKEWYENLPEENKVMVDDLMADSYEEAVYDENESEDI